MQFINFATGQREAKNFDFVQWGEGLFLKKEIGIGIEKVYWVIEKGSRKYIYAQLKV